VLDLSVSTFPGKLTLPIVANATGFKDYPQVAIRPVLRKMSWCTSNSHLQCVALPTLRRA